MNIKYIAIIKHVVGSNAKFKPPPAVALNRKIANLPFRYSTFVPLTKRITLSISLRPILFDGQQELEGRKTL